MSYLVFQLMFAALAVALAVVAALIVREVRKRRAVDRPSEEHAETEAPQPRKVGLGRRAASPAPAEAPARRRQLQSFVEQERQAEGMEAPPIAPEAAAQPLPEPANETGLEDTPDSGPEPDLASESDLGPEPDLDRAVMGRLEAAFEALQAGEITLDAYRERIEAEEAALDRRIATLGSSAGEPELDAALAARESVRWCLGWADEQAGGISS